jgi:hypothetical protein
MTTMRSPRNSALLAPLLGLAVTLSGCAANQSGGESLVQGMEPQARTAAQERAATDLNCGATEILGAEHGNLSDPYALKRVVYRVQVTGCGLRTVYSVACVHRSVCSAISEGGTVERVPK